MNWPTWRDGSQRRSLSIDWSSLSESQQNSSWLAFRDRFPWLSANIAGGILAAVLTKFFEVELQQAVALALFIPVVLALAKAWPSIGKFDASVIAPSTSGLADTLNEDVDRAINWPDASGWLAGWLFR